jgi:NADH-quinone oxidoreductase subunit N
MLPNADLFPNLLPTVLVAAGALVTLALEPFLRTNSKHSILPWIAAFFLIAAGASLVLVVPGNIRTIIAMNSVRQALLLALLACGLLGIAGLSTQLAKRRFAGGEAYALLLLSLCGSMLMVQSIDLLALFVGMELSAIPIYALVGMHRRSTEANEGIFKYFVTGSIFGAVFLYGGALWYGATGSTSLFAVALPSRELLQMAGLVLVVFAMLFKAGAAPFHFWVADTYTGASIPVTGFMSSTVKIGAITALATIYAHVNQPAFGNLPLVIIVVAILSLLIGSFTGLAQTRARRMMAFSAVGNAGYLVLALLLPAPSTALPFYLITYALASALVLAGLSALAGVEEQDDDFGSLRGMARANPFLGSVITLALVSLAGLPPVAGFIAKFGVLAGVFASGHIALAALGMVIAVVSAGYYFRLALLLWQDPGEQATKVSGGVLLRVSLLLGAGGLLVLTAFPML